MTRHRARRWREPTLCAHCRGTIPSWQRLCAGCWRLLPWSFRQPILDAREAKAPHRVATGVVNAVQWLKAHSPAAEAARRQGERDA